MNEIDAQIMDTRRAQDRERIIAQLRYLKHQFPHLALSIPEEEDRRQLRPPAHRQYARAGRRHPLLDYQEPAGYGLQRSILPSPALQEVYFSNAPGVTYSPQSQWTGPVTAEQAVSDQEAQRAQLYGEGATQAIPDWGYQPTSSGVMFIGEPLPG